MPQSITIAAFVLGAVLVLIALLGGGFKIFGTEVSGTTGTVQRIVAGALGALLIVVGLVGSFDFSTHQPVDFKPPTPAPNPHPAPAETANIGGQWRDEVGNVYNIIQSDGDFTFQAYSPSSGVRSQGNGRIVGKQVTSNFQVSTPSGIPASGTGRGTVIDDRTMVGTFTDSYYGAYSHTLTRAD